MIAVAKKMALRTSDEARNTTSSAGRRSPSGLPRSSRRRRNTFSTSMMASSTNAPIAIVRPPSVMVLMVPPKAETTMIPASSANGMASAEINVVRQEPRKRKRMMTTRMAPSRSATVTLRSAMVMKSAWRKFSFSITTPAGSALPMRSSASSMVVVSSRVLAPGCFCTERITAGFVLYEAVPRAGSGPQATFATSPMRIGAPLVARTTVEATSSGWRARPTPRTRYSWPDST